MLKVYEVREKNRRIGVGLIGLHEWLLKRGYDYSMNPELKRWLMTWEMRSEQEQMSCVTDWLLIGPSSTGQ